MSKDHRFFHRRMAQAATQVVTVEIVATVDTSGNLVAQETLTPQFPPEPTAAAVVANAPAIPSIIAPFVSPLAPALPVTPVPQAAVSDIRVPAVPQAITSALQNLSPAPALATVLAVPAALPSLELLSIPQVPAAPTVATPVLPVVPSVPPFPSDLRVPSVPPFPFSTGGVVAQTAAATTSAATSDAPVNVAALAISSSLSAPAISESISAVSSNAASIPSASLIVSALGSPGPTSSSDTQSSVLYSGKASETRSAFLTSSTTQSDAAVSTYFGGGGGSGVPGGAAAPTSGFGTSASEQQNGPTTPLETPQVVGSVVGSLAGAALILAIVLLLLRRHKRRRGGALQLSDNDHVDNDRSMRQAPPRPARASVIPAAFLNRFSGMSRSTTETNLSGGERSFQRVSGRKLPSVFSEGMTSDQFSRGGTMSESSFYQDDHGIYGGAALDKEFGKEIGDSPRNRESGHMNFRPGPARTPMIRNLDDPFSDAYRSHLSPPQSPNSNIHPRGTLGRSLPSADGSRSSRFTENV